MSTTFEKKQIISSTELVRSFSKYLGKDLEDHELYIFKRNVPEAVLVSYARYEEMEKRIEELKDFLEHVAIYNIVQQRKDSKEEEIAIEELEEKYGS